jgi:two-component system secretion response regulator SsrB
MSTSEAPPIRVLYVDNDPWALDAFGSLMGRAAGVEMRAVGGRQEDIEAACASHQPDIVLIDLYLDPRGPDGLEVASKLAASIPGLAAIVCTSSESPVDAARTWAAGIRAFVTKRQLLRRPSDTQALLRSVLDGCAIYHVDPRSAVAEKTPLTRREGEILARKMTGESHRLIADRLCISVRTIDSHLANIRTKLQADSIQEALEFAARRGLLDGFA